MSNHNEFAAQVIRHLPEMTEADRQVWIKNPRRLKTALAAAFAVALPQGEMEKANPFLRPLPGAEALPLRECDDTRTLAQAEDVFMIIDPDFKKWGLDVAGLATPETLVEVHEQVKNGTFRQLFGSLSTDLDKLCLSQVQIAMFCQDHHNWLRQDGWATFFLFKVAGRFFVASVNVYSDGLGVGVFRFENGRVWRAGNRERLVSLQLATQ